MRKFDAAQSTLLPERSTLLTKGVKGMVRDDGKTVRDVSNQSMLCLLGTHLSIMLAIVLLSTCPC